MGEAAGQAEERVHLVEREVTEQCTMYISKEGNRKTVVKKAQDGMGKGDHVQSHIQGLEAVGTITAATKLIEVKQRKVRRKTGFIISNQPHNQSSLTFEEHFVCALFPSRFLFPFLQTTERRNAQLKADLEEEEEQMKKLWEDITVRWINQNNQK